MESQDSHAHLVAVEEWISKTHLRKMVKTYVLPAFVSIFLAFGLAYGAIWYSIQHSRYDTCITRVETRHDYRTVFFAILEVFPPSLVIKQVHDIIDVTVPELDPIIECPMPFI